MTNKMILGIATAMVCTLLSLVTFFSSFYVNEEYERGLVTRMGVVNEVTSSGFHWKMPFVDSVHVADTRLQQLEYPNLQVATNDGQVIGVTLTINHRIQPDNLAQIPVLFEQFGPMFNYEATFLRNMSQDRLKSVIGDYAMENFMENRGEIRIETMRQVMEAAERYGIVIEEVQISDVQFSPAYRDRLEEVARARAQAAEAQQNSRREAFLADAAIQQARGRAESRILEGEAQAQYALATAQAQAEATRMQGEAEAEVMRLHADVLRESSELIQYTIAQSYDNWDGSTPSQVVYGGGGENGLSGHGILPLINMTNP